MAGMEGQKGMEGMAGAPAAPLLLPRLSPHGRPWEMAKEAVKKPPRAEEVIAF
jgi:hypothetical protein